MNTSTSTLTVSEGKTLVYLIPGVLIIAVAIPFLFFFWPIALLLLTLAIILFTAETGLEIDLNEMKRRKYKSIFGNKFGIWVDLGEILEFQLKLSVESESIRNPFPVAGSWNNTSKTQKSITYDLISVDNFSQRKIIYEFLEYKLAKKLLHELNAKGHFETTDYIAIKLEENREKRARR